MCLNTLARGLEITTSPAFSATSSSVNSATAAWSSRTDNVAATSGVTEGAGTVAEQYATLVEHLRDDVPKTMELRSDLSASLNVLLKELKAMSDVMSNKSEARLREAEAKDGEDDDHLTTLNDIHTVLQSIQGQMDAVQKRIERSNAPTRRFPFFSQPGE